MPLAAASGADLIEIRLDLFPTADLENLPALLREVSLPLIVTVRSRAEGGRFTGGPEEWRALVTPYLPVARYVDIEQRFSSCAPAIRAAGVKVIASFHTPTILKEDELVAIEARLRTFGDLPKIVTGVGTRDDLLTLLQFTSSRTAPICTSIMGEQCRFGRGLLPLFSSMLVYCYITTPASAGQYPVGEMRTILSLLT
ncbi:dehydroquinase class I [Methanosphaerula palustris E1-9c]|uniref:3-dehydroquinate dehydratase n=2 Tax=Methanosphaerula palustris TaxID=475088 RepID=B8GF67_METPE|nr:dehydroquinase class I [Methanosphaerula palustris E1-9c]